MTLSIMLLDMLKLRRLPKSRHVPIQFPQPLMQRRIPRANISDVAFEMLDVHRIKADDGRVQSHIRFGDALSEIERRCLLREMLLCAVEGREERLNGFLVCGLGGGEAGFIDAVVDVVVGPVVRAFDLTSKFLGKQINGLVLLREQVVEFGVEHADDLAGLVADDFVLLDVVEGGDGEAAGVVGVDAEIYVAEVGDAFVDGVGGHTVAWSFAFRGCESPALGTLVGLACVGEEPPLPFSSISQWTEV